MHNSMGPVVLLMLHAPRNKLPRTRVPGGLLDGPAETSHTGINVAEATHSS